jgi:hypothetical protein
MIVITLLQLILDNNGVTIFVLGDQINAEVASGSLALCTGEREIYGIVKDVNVLLKPLREVVCLMLPDLPERNPWILPIVVGLGSSTALTSRISISDLLRLLPHVDLAGDGGRDQSRPVLSQLLDVLLHLADESDYLGGFLVEKLNDDLLLPGWREREPMFTEFLCGEVHNRTLVPLRYEYA